jgi:FKBP-type peptidyl-prolyl cis-trans isomerase
MRPYCCLLLVLTISLFSAAQSPVIIPGSTGYAIPAETNTNMFSETAGLRNWTDAKQQIRYYFYARQKGDLSLGLNVRADQLGNILQVAVADKKLLVRVPASRSFRAVGAGTVTLPDSGFYTITISVIKKTGKAIADIQSLFLSGAPAATLHFNPKPRRNAASVHLRYPLADSVKAISFYNEVTVPAGFDPVHSYYMATGFARGYFGMQVNGPNERRIIFSVWDAGREAVDRNKVADSNRVQLLAQGDGVTASDFGNEGTGGHSHWLYDWKAGITYRFIVTALPDSASSTTIYSGYFFVPELQRWKLIASFRAPSNGKTLRNLYSFNENFDGSNGQLQRKAMFGNQWIQRSNGSWLELTQATFSYDATGKAGDRIDYGGGVSPDGKFYLWNGGFERPNAVAGQLFQRPAAQKPVVDLAKNADSTAQAIRDREEIMAAIRKGQDTTGSIDGIYYKILRQGTGEQVRPADTVTILYKGTLLKDGTVFDETKDKPATFPLKRLIRGWQLVLPMCKVGGSVRIIIPSGQSYGMRARTKIIVPNSVLVFDIDVIGTKR